MLNQIHLLNDINEWKQAISSFPEICRDIYFTPEYLQMYVPGNSGQAICLKYQEKKQIWLFPVLCNPIHKIGNILLPSGLYDLETAYGYGGPLSNSDNQDFLQRANQALIYWAKNNGIVAQFIRFHPLLGNEQWMKDNQLDISFDRYTVSVDIDKLDHLPFYDKTTRNILDRGHRLGIEVRQLDIDNEFSIFLSLYHDAMERLGAEPYYFFDDRHFDRLRLLVRENGFLIGAFHQQRMIAAAVFFFGSCWLHYHLSASDFDSRVPGATNLILDMAFQKAKSQQIQRIHLGGGRTPKADDSLLKFKKSMSTDLHRFYIGKRIYNPTVYKNLVDTWKQEYPTLVDQYQAKLLCYRYSL
jgi:hypothetical protein